MEDHLVRAALGVPVTTVAFVAYLFQGQVRRVGPLPLEAAESLAKEVSRRPGCTKVSLEKWGCISVEQL